MTFLIAFAALSAGVHALSIGAVAKNPVESVLPGESVKFFILVWNVEGDVENVSVTVTEEKPWEVRAEPKRFTIGGPIGSEYILLGGKSVKASEINVYAAAPEDAKGANTILLEIRVENQQPGVGFSQGVVINLTADTGIDEKKEGGPAAVIPNVATESRPRNSSEGLDAIMIALVPIIVISYIIYRRP